MFTLILSTWPNNEKNEGIQYSFKKKMTLRKHGNVMYNLDSASHPEKE